MIKDEEVKSHVLQLLMSKMDDLAANDMGKHLESKKGLPHNGVLEIDVEHTPLKDAKEIPEDAGDEFRHDDKMVEHPEESDDDDLDPEYDGSMIKELMDRTKAVKKLRGE